MRVLEQKQAQELLNIPYDPNNASGVQHLAVSAPTTPPRINAVLPGELHPNVVPGRSQQPVDPETLLKAVGSVASDKRKSVTLTPAIDLTPDPLQTPMNGNQGFARTAGAKSMPASRRTSASGDDDELSGHLQGLSLVNDRTNRVSPAPAPASASILTRGPVRLGDEERTRYGTAYNAGMLLDKQLDQEMHSKLSKIG
jgi:hypothetical protein